MSGQNIGANAAAAVDGEIAKFRDLQQTVQTHQSSLGTLMAQRNENEMVKQELDVIENESSSTMTVLYKQVGPVLMKNDLSEARETVEKRLEFISNEIKKTEGLVGKKEKELQVLAVKIQEMQGAMQRAAVEAAKSVAQQQAA